MARLRSDSTVPEVYPDLTPEERRRLARTVVPASEAVASAVPPALRPTEDAAREADERCLRELAANEASRSASWALAGKGGLGK